MQNSTESETKPPRKYSLVFWSYFLLLAIISGLLVIIVGMHKEKIARQPKDINAQSQLSADSFNNSYNDQNAANVAKTQITDAYALTRAAAMTLEQDSNLLVAKQLLELATANLSGTQDPKLIAIKNKLNTDLDLLNKAIAPDYAAIQNKLAQLSDSISMLPTSSTHLDAVTTIHDDNKIGMDNATNKKWLATLRNFLADIKFVIKIKKKNPNDNHRTFINIEQARSQLSLMVEQMRWALTHNNNMVYHNSIKVAQDLLNNNFDPNSDKVQKATSILQELAQTQLLQHVPNLNDTVKSLQELLVG